MPSCAILVEREFNQRSKRHEPFTRTAKLIRHVRLSTIIAVGHESLGPERRLMARGWLVLRNSV